MKILFKLLTGVLIGFSMATFGMHKPEFEVHDAENITYCSDFEIEFSAHDILQFHVAAHTGDLQRVLQYLQAGMDANIANQHNVPALHYAASAGQIAVMKALVDHNANINTVAIYEKQHGMTALHCAAKKGKTEAIKFLLNAGACPNILTNQSEHRCYYTPLVFAVCYGHLSSVRALLDGGADPNLAMPAGKNKGMVPLHHAITYKREAVLRLLILCGAHVNRPDNENPLLNRFPLYALNCDGGSAIVDLFKAGALFHTVGTHPYEVEQIERDNNGKVHTTKTGPFIPFFEEIPLCYFLLRMDAFFFEQLAMYKDDSESLYDSEILDAIVIAFMHRQFSKGVILYELLKDRGIDPTDAMILVMYHACAQGNAKLINDVIAMLQRDENPFHTDMLGDFLRCAIAANRYNAVETLLKHGATPENFASLLKIAVINNFKEIVKLLIFYGAPTHEAEAYILSGQREPSSPDGEEYYRSLIASWHRRQMMSMVTRHQPTLRFNALPVNARMLLANYIATATPSALDLCSP